ncbi:phage tail protein [Citrobacter sp. Cu096]|uniref:phage tail protein n=1 Tax=Citrobacter sp. Cu096 TaxID=2985158 RepID=UPI00257500EF|nr:phage tail protein [Citrobacter sp. Cu096]MDM2741889.1 phage tail protein [Citrobacter sp. Cu096]
MEIFHWKIRPDMTMEAEPQVITVKMGDGYEQRRPAGLNGNLAKYNVTIKVRKGEHQRLEAFLSRHGGVKSFLWTPPYTWTQIRVVCRKWSVSVGAMWVTYTTTFEQVVI